MGESVFCRCGASWHGEYVRAAQSHILRDGCGGMSHENYKALFRCKCPDCDQARKRDRAQRKLKMPTIAEMEAALRAERESSSHEHSALTAIVERIIKARKRHD